MPPLFVGAWNEDKRGENLEQDTWEEVLGGKGVESGAGWMHIPAGGATVAPGNAGGAAGMSQSLGFGDFGSSLVSGLVWEEEAFHGLSSNLSEFPRDGGNGGTNPSRAAKTQTTGELSEIRENQPHSFRRE